MPKDESTQDEPTQPFVFQLREAHRAKIIQRLLWACLGVYVLLPAVAYLNHHPQLNVFTVIAVIAVVLDLLVIWLFKSGKLKS